MHVGAVSLAVFLLEHVVLGDLLKSLFWWKHCWEWLEVWGIVVSVHDPVVIADVHRERDSDGESGEFAPSTEISLRLVMVVDVWEVVLDERHWVDGNTTVRRLTVATEEASNWPEEEGTSQRVNHKLATLCNFLVAIVDPSDTLGTCHVLTETVSDPRIISETLGQEFLVFQLHLAGRNRWQLFLEQNLELVFGIVLVSVLLRGVIRLRKPMHIGVVKLGRHVSSAL